MGVNDLLARLAGRVDTPNTPRNPPKVSGKPAQIGACTLDIPDTPETISLLHDADFCPDSEVDRNILKRCPYCQHFARPGKSDGYCSERNDLPLAYGTNHPLRRLPDDRGVSCQPWSPAKYW